MQKNVHGYLIKNTFICWSKLKTEKLLATAKQLLFEKSGNFFSQIEHRDRFDRHIAPLAPVPFRLLFNDPPSSLHSKHSF